MATEAQGGMHRVAVINPYVPARTELIGSNAKQATSADIGKAVKLSGVTTALCAYGDPIYGFIESVEVSTKGGYSIGGVLCDQGVEVYATDEAGTLAVGDFVVSGTPAAFGTAVGAKGANVVKAQATAVNQLLNTGGLAIATTKSLVKIANNVKALINGQYVTKTAADLPALSGTIAGTTEVPAYNVWCFFMDASGTVTPTLGTAGTSAATVEFPPIPANQVMLGFIMVSCTIDFIGGTTLLDAANTTVTYTDTPFPMGTAPADKWLVMARYTSGAYSGGVLLRKV